MAEVARIPFPETVDSTMLAAGRSCLQKLYLEFFNHWKGKEPNVHLHAGKAYADGLEKARKAFYEDGRPSEDCIAIGLEALLKSYGTFDCPDDSAKSANRVAGALEYYFERYPLDTDKAVPIVLPDAKRMIEFGGVEPLEIKHPVTGNPILYSWRLDAGVEYEGMRLGLDDKTTSSLGASWPRQWDLRSQFTSYVWGAGRQKVNLQGFLVRGVSILKTKYDTLQALTYRPAWQIDRWLEQVHRDLVRWIQAWEEGYFDYNLDHACNEYGGCQFRQACQMPDPTSLLEQHFERRRWDPVTRTEIVL